MRFYYSLKTLEPVIVSKTTATINNHQGLDYISGSAILGLVAGSVYRQYADQSELTWSLFHSGEVQFGPCYPVVESQLSLPTPASWHYEKGQVAIQDGLYLGKAITNHTCYERKNSTQYQQCRDGFVTGAGQASDIKTGLTTKTALDRSNGSVKDGSLFSYCYLEAGQTFIGWVEYDSQEQLTLVKEALLGKRRIGRSRSAEFGLVSIVEAALNEVHEEVKQKDSLVLWCLSDCEVLNQQGLPSLTPDLSDLMRGAQGELDRTKSFIRATSVSRFNQARLGIDSEQVLISKGSVLVFKNISITSEQLFQLETKGIGINRQQGLGWIKVNPAWAFEPELSEQLYPSLCFDITEGRANVIQADTPMVRWLSSKVKQEEQNQDIDAEANTLLKELIKAYTRLRNYNHILNSHDAGPSHTQWGRVRESVKSNKAHWYSELFENHDIKNSTAICKSVNDLTGWGICWLEQSVEVSFTQYCQGLFKNQGRDVILLVIEKLSRYELCNYQGLKRAKCELLGENA